VDECKPLSYGRAPGRVAVGAGARLPVGLVDVCVRCPAGAYTRPLISSTWAGLVEESFCVQFLKIMTLLSTEGTRCIL